MTATVMMNWGGFQFHQTKAAFNQLQRTTAYTWATIGRTGTDRRPAKQFVGQGEDKLTLSGIIFGMYNAGGGDSYTGTGHIDEIREKASQGRPFLLIDGTGTQIGKFVLSSITEGQSVFIREGIPRKQTYTLSFERYGND